MLQYLEAYNIGMPCQESNHLIIYHFIELLTPQKHGSHLPLPCMMEVTGS